MKRVIVDYSKLTEAILNLLVEKYPDGYNDSDIIKFKNMSGETVEAVEVRTEDTIYLVKVSVKLEQSMIDYADDDEDEDEDDDLKEATEKVIDFEDDDIPDTEEDEVDFDDEMDTEDEDED